ncbi:MAG: WYL domain-containing protein [Solibacillus sp.]
MTQEKEKQIQRILSMYERLKKGEPIVKREEATNFKISEKSIQRDLDSIRAFIETSGANKYITYDRAQKAYVYETEQPTSLTTEEIFAVLKVIIESRAFPKQEMDSIVEKLMELAKKDDQPLIKLMMVNEKHYYTELNHKKDLLERLWQLTLAIHSKKVIEMDYKRENSAASTRKVKPVAIIFSEYYFYLIAYPEKSDYDYPIVYRVDRIEHFQQTAQTFKVPYHERFQEGEFRKRVQFMYTGELLTVKFRFTGKSPQAMLDRLPTAKIIQQDDTGMTIEAEVFGKGIKMWLLSQGEYIEVLEPREFREEMEESVRAMLSKYAGVLQ